MQAWLTLSGSSLSIGGVLAASGWLLFAAADPRYRNRDKWSWVPANALVMAGGMLMALGLSGFQTTMGDRAEWLGLTGTFAFMVGLILSHVAVQSVQAFSEGPIPRRLIRIAQLFLIPGAILFLLSVLLSDVYSSVITTVLIVATFGANVAPLFDISPRLRNVGETLLPLTILWLGIKLLTL